MLALSGKVAFMVTGISVGQLEYDKKDRGISQLVGRIVSIILWYTTITFRNPEYVNRRSYITNRLSLG